MQKFLGRQQISTKRRTDITSLISAWCTENLRPVSIVADGGFIRLLNLIEPGYSVPSRTTIGASIRREYAELLQSLVRLLDVVDGLAVTTDLWSSSMNIAYATYTGHFIDPEWHLCTVVLDNSTFPDRHTAANIAEFTKSVLSDLKVDQRSKLIAVVSDQATNMVAAFNLLREDDLHLFTVACACHSLQTAIRHALDTPATSKLLGQCRCLVGHFNHSNVATNALCERQKAEGVRQPLRPVAEVTTRWNSTHDTLCRLWKLRSHITAVLEDITVMKAADQPLNLSSAQWKLVKCAADMLEPFRGVTNDLSSSKKVTISTVLPVMFGLVGKCAQAEDDSAFIFTLKERLASNLSTKFHLASIPPDSCEAIAAAHNPRFKGLMFPVGGRPGGYF